MTKQIAFYFDFGSPTAYLAYTQLKKFEETYDVKVDFEPMLLGAVLKATNNMAPATVPAKGRYLLMHDLPRFVKRYQVPFKMNPHFPVNTLQLMRGCYAAKELGCFERYVERMFKALWVEALNMGDIEVVGNCLKDIDINPETFLGLIESEEIKDQLKANTDAALKRGIFGAPTMFLDKEMYFGQDRLDFLEQALRSD